MGEIANRFATAFRDFVTNALPASGPHEPSKSEIRAIAIPIEAGIAAAALSGTDLEAAMALIEPLLESAQASEAAAQQTLIAAQATQAVLQQALAEIPEQVAEQLNTAADRAVSQATVASEAAASLSAVYRDQSAAKRNEAEAFSETASGALAALLANGRAYATTAAGLAAVAEGDAFVVQGDGTSTYATLYRKQSGAAVLIAAYPSLGAVQSALTSTAFIMPVNAVITTLPAAPVDGDRYLVAASGTTGSLVGKENQVAERVSGVWTYSGLPATGTALVVQATNATLVYGETDGWLALAFDLQDGLDATADITGVIAAAVAAGGKAVRTPVGVRKFKAGFSDANPRGLPVSGGAIIEMTPDEDVNSWRLRDSYADHLGHVVGAEYLTSIAWARFSGVTLRGTLLGDSTTKGFPNEGGDFAPESLLDNYAKQWGGFSSTNIQNLAINGSTPPSMPIDQIRADDHFVLIGHGINSLPGGLQQFYDDMDAKLTAIRQQYPYEQAATASGAAKDIILKGLNSVSHWEAGAGQSEAEKMRGVYVALARKHHCCFIDIYAHRQDSTGAVPWLDQNTFPGETQTNAGVHPLPAGADDIWSKVGDAILGGGIRARANAFYNRDPAGASILVTAKPNSFPKGLAWDSMAGAGWPFLGFVETRYHAQGFYHQTAYRYTAGGSPAARAERISVSPTAWGPWSFAWTTLVTQNGWAKESAGTLYQVKADPYGTTRVRGTIVKTGPHTAGTVLSTLGATFRPPQDVVCIVWADGSGAVPIRIAVNGEISLLVDTPANMLRMDTLSWVAASF